MKHKTGKCIDCGPSSSDKPIIAGRCHTHYWPHRAKEKAKKPAAKKKAAHKQTLSDWFAMQVMLCRVCENCNEPIHGATRTNIAHIVPKSIFSEVATHPLNRWFGCWQCHTNYDQWPAERVAEMPVAKIARARYATFSDEVLRVNRHRVPLYLTQELT